VANRDPFARTPPLRPPPPRGECKALDRGCKCVTGNAEIAPAGASRGAGTQAS
jgi:hypothetical protein